MVMSGSVHSDDPRFRGLLQDSLTHPGRATAATGQQRIRLIAECRQYAGKRSCAMARSFGAMERQATDETSDAQRVGLPTTGRLLHRTCPTGNLAARGDRSQTHHQEPDHDVVLERKADHHAGSVDRTRHGSDKNPQRGREGRGDEDALRPAHSGSDHVPIGSHRVAERDSVDGMGHAPRLRRASPGRG